MKLKFLLIDPEYSANSVLEFAKEGMSPFWLDSFFYFFPDIKKDMFFELNHNERFEFLKEYFTNIKDKNYDELLSKNNVYNSYWQMNEPEIVSAFEDVFEIDLSNEFNDLICQTSFNPINPRYLDHNKFEHFYLESEKGALGTALHEITHFIWFHVWQKNFNDDAANYETPHLKWILSEMVVEPIMKKSGLSSLNPYYGSKSCVYPYFYTMKTDGKPILEELFILLETNNITSFMEKAYAYCMRHEVEIRQHICESEKESLKN